MSTIARVLWLRALLVVVALPLAIAGCGKAAPTIDQLLASGKVAQAKGEHKVAIIQFGNVIQNQPTHAEANYLSGLEYLRRPSRVGLSQSFVTSGLPGAVRSTSRLVRNGSN